MGIFLLIFFTISRMIHTYHTGGDDLEGIKIKLKKKNDIIAVRYTDYSGT